jgi:hypothetical protein
MVAAVRRRFQNIALREAENLLILPIATSVGVKSGVFRIAASKRTADPYLDSPFAPLRMTILNDA